MALAAHPEVPGASGARIVAHGAFQLKHGKVPGYATPGDTTQEITDMLLGYGSHSLGSMFADVPDVLAASSDVPSEGWMHILAAGAVEFKHGEVSA